MLILIVSITVLASFAIEEVIHRLKNTYEIEWPALVIKPENALALEVARRLRKSGQNLNGM